MAAGQSIKAELARAAKAAKAGDWIGAVTAYQAVLSRFPVNKPARSGLSAIRQKAVPDVLTKADQAEAKRDWTNVERYLRAAVTLGVSEPVVLRGLARARAELGDAFGALKVVEPVLKAIPEDAVALNIKARALREMGALEASREVLTTALGTPKMDAATLSSLAVTDIATGDKAAARDHLQRALTLTPDSAEIHRNLSLVTDYREDAAHLDHMRASLARIGANTQDAAQLHFALFEALDQLEEKDAAFAHLQKANHLTKQELGYDFQADALPYALSKALFKGGVPAVAVTGRPRPIFVTGMPRSGTTLVERILAADPRARACGELTVVARAVGQVVRDVVTRDVKALTARDVQMIGETILKGLADYAQGAEVVIDKMPLNFRWIGYICAALPEARIVHCQRDPMAVAWSNYRNRFAGQGVGYCYDFDDIARFLVMEKDLMAFWKTLYPDQIHVVDYGALVSDTEAQTRAMAKATGLTWSEAWLHPEKATSMILTASSDQARRPIYKGSDAGWQRYADQLAPLQEGLRAAGILAT